MIKRTNPEGCNAGITWECWKKTSREKNTKEIYKKNLIKQTSEFDNFWLIILRYEEGEKNILL